MPFCLPETERWISTQILSTYIHTNERFYIRVIFWVSHTLRFCCSFRSSWRSAIDDDDYDDDDVLLLMVVVLFFCVSSDRYQLIRLKRGGVRKKNCWKKEGSSPGKFIYTFHSLAVGCCTFLLSFGNIILGSFLLVSGWLI